MTTYVATVALSAVLSALLLFAAAAAIATALGGTDLGSSGASAQAVPQSTPSDPGVLAHLLLVFTSYSFLAAHFTPLELSGLGGATYSAVGVGSVTIAAVALIVPFMFARRLERRMPMSTMGMATGRGALIGAPYWIGALALYIPSFLSVGPDQLAISIHPSGVGVIVPALVVAAGGSVGAASARAVRNPVSRSLSRGIGRGTLGIIAGVLLTGLITVVWVGLEYLTRSSTGTGSTSGSLTPAGQALGWSLLALVPFYIANGLLVVWSAATGGLLFGSAAWHPLIYLGPVLGALIAGLQLRRQPDRIEQASFAATFAVATAVIGMLTTPAIINGPSLVSTGWTGALVALAIGIGAAFASPYLLAIPTIAKMASAAPIRWLSKPVLAALPREDLHPVDFLEDASTVAVPSIRLRKVHGVIAAALIVLLAGGVAANAQLSARFSPDATAVDYLVAQSHGDATAMWSMATFEGSSATSTPLLTKDALTKMLAFTPNTDLKDISVTDASRTDDSNFNVTVQLTKSEQQTTMRLHLRRDTSRSNWVVYPAWKVVIQPSTVQITGFNHAGKITIDGLDTGVSDTGGSVEVIPGQHQVDLAATDIFTGDHQIIDASNDTSITFKAILTAAATASVHKTIGDLFTRCAATNQLRPAGCPNSAFTFGDHQSNVRWSVVGDPTAAMKLSIGDQLDTIEAQGDWTMHVSYDYWYDFDSSYVQHEDDDVRGYFDDILRWNGSGFDIESQSGY